MPSSANNRLVIVHPDATTLAHAVAERLLSRLLDAQSTHAPVHVVLTGGTLGIALLAAAATSKQREAVDWSQVHLWWGDERYLPAGDPDRNETQAREALLNSLVATSGLPERNIHAMPALVAGVSTDQAAEAYAIELAQWADPAGDESPSGNESKGVVGDSALAVPRFDVLMLGMGPDAHVASLFPGHPGLLAQGVTAGVEGSPKPPPQRVTLTFDAIRTARDVWVVVSGAGKAAALSLALSPAATAHVAPASAVWGIDHTLWLVDVDAVGDAALPSVVS